MALYELCKPGAPGRGDVAWAIESILVNNPQVNRDARMTLAKGLNWLAIANPPAISREEAATTAAAALEAEYKSMPKAGQPGYEQSKQLQLELLRQIGQYNHKKVYPALEAMIEQHPMPEVKAQAEKLLSDMRDRLMPIKAAVTVDQISSVEQRAEILGRAITSNDVNETCQAIFASFSGSPVRTSDDPRLPLLYRALEDSSEKVRLAAAWMLVESSNAEDLERGVVALADLSVNSARSGYRGDADALLNSVAGFDANYAAMVKRARERAKTRKTK
jgi:hypothetical protein